MRFPKFIRFGDATQASLGVIYDHLALAAFPQVSSGLVFWTVR